MLPDRPLKEPSQEELAWLMPLLIQPTMKIIGTGVVTFVYPDRPFPELDYDRKHLAESYMVFPTRIQNCLYFIWYPFGGILEISDLTEANTKDGNGIEIQIAVFNIEGFKARVVNSVKISNTDITQILLAYANLPKDAFLSPEELQKLSEGQDQNDSDSKSTTTSQS